MTHNTPSWPTTAIGRIVAVALITAHLSYAQAVAPPSLSLPHGQNLRDRPAQASDLVLDIDRDGRLVLNAMPVGEDRIASQLDAILGSPAGDKVLYLRADAGVRYARILAVNALAARAGACLAALVATQEPGTASVVLGDAGQEYSLVRRAIDLQLPAARASTQSAASDGRIVLEVLPGPAYRINTESILPVDLQRRLREIYDNRPLRVLFVKGDQAVTYQDVFHAIDIARGAGVIVFRAMPDDDLVPERLPAIDLSVRLTRRDEPGGAGRCRSEGDEAAPLADPTPVYFAFQVEKPATPVAGTGVPQYPAVLRSAKVPGHVLVQFVVDTSGLVLSETFKVLRTDHILFAEAVRVALPAMRFTPATIRGRPVRQLVQQPFVFAPSP